MARPAVHPGKVLAAQLEPLNISPTELARQLAVPANRISQIINGKRAITGDTALRLAHWFGTGPEYWLNLQNLFDLSQAQRQSGVAIGRLPSRSAVSSNFTRTSGGKDE